MYYNNKIIFKLYFLINLILSKSIYYNIYSIYYKLTKDIYIYVKKYASHVPLFHILFFFPQEIHPCIVLVRISRTESINWYASLRREGKKRQHHSSRCVPPWFRYATQRGRLDTYFPPWVDESCTRERRRATLPAAFSAMYRESSTWVANIARVCLWRKQVSNRFSSSVTGIPASNGMEFESVAVFHNTGNGGNPSKIRMQTLE